MKIGKGGLDNLFISPPIFQGLSVRGFFTTKALNGDLQNISRLSGLPISSFYHPIQKHTDRIVVLTDSMDRKVADAVITSRTDVMIGVDVADCLPILLYDRRLNVIGAVHAGWRGTAGMILKKTILKMGEVFNSMPQDILIAMGPAIKGCCYEVGVEVIETVEIATGKGNYYIDKGDKYLLDLSAANMYQAFSLGIPSGNIWVSEYCTFCHPEKFYSYRYAKGKTGRQSGYIVQK
jgi:YfiH family protein